MIQTPEKHNRRSPCAPASKTKGTSFFPKIQRNEAPVPAKPIVKQIGKRNYHQSIFKIKGDIPARIKLPAHLPDVDDQKVRQSQHYRDLEAQIEGMEAKFRQELKDIDSKKEAISDQLLSGRDEMYQQKYTLWELRNEIMNLEGALREQSQEHDRLLYELGYDGQEEQSQGPSDREAEGDMSDAQNYD